MPTEVQKIPGAFNLPANWPKVEFPNIDSGILFDWWADDLALGSASTWVDRKSGKELKLATNFDAPVVVNGPNNHKALTFNQRSKLTAAITGLIPQNTSIAVVYNVDPECSTASRLLSGQSGFRTWTPGVGSRMHINATRVAGSGALGTAQSGPIIKGTWQTTAARYVSGKEIYARTLNGEPVTAALAVGDIDQQTLIVGYNTAGTIGSESTEAGYKGMISRLVIWDKSLTDVDIDAFLAIQKNIFKLP